MCLRIPCGPAAGVGVRVPGHRWRWYASVARPVVAFIDELRQRHDRQVIVLIPVIVPDRFRYRLLHNHIDAVLSAELRGRDDVIVARVPLPLRRAST